MAENNRLPQASYELLWWAFTLVLAALVLAPVYNYIPDFPFFLPNFVYIVVAITLTRYLFFLKITWLRDHLAWQAGISFLLIPLTFWMVQYFPPDTAEVMNIYLNNEYKFFAIWAIAAAVVTPFRFLYNVWMRYRAGVRKW